MLSAWLRNPLPRGLYGRAALILVVPIVTIQLVVSIVFIQRHFEGVTEQMTETVMLDLRYLIDQVDQTPDIESARSELDALKEPLALRATLPATPEQRSDEDRRHIYDLSGRVVIETLRDGVPGLQAVDLVSDRRTVLALVQSRHGPILAEIERRRVSASNPHQLLVWLIFTGLLMALIAFFFLRNQLRPIRRLAQAAEAFGKGRALAYRPSGAAEVRAAGRAFLEMRARIERQIEQRTMMLSGVSHDLRTPLTRLRLGLSMLDYSPEVREMTRDVDDMEVLLDAFLAFARADAQDEPDPTDPVAMVREAVERARRGDRNVKLDVIGSDPGQVPLRRHVLSRALDNLIANALRYGTRAQVTLRIGADDAIRISVEDDGPGIPAARRAEALRPFTRLDTARNQDRGSGVGLGLTIALDAARAHGGTLDLSDSADLGGLQAVMTLPL